MDRLHKDDAILQGRGRTVAKATEVVCGKDHSAGTMDLSWGH